MNLSFPIIVSMQFCCIYLVHFFRPCVSTHLWSLTLVHHCVSRQSFPIHCMFCSIAHRIYCNNVPLNKKINIHLFVESIQMNSIQKNILMTTIMATRTTATKGRYNARCEVHTSRIGGSSPGVVNRRVKL